MEQNSYINEIILCLLRGDKHLRGIARELGRNHMTVKRRLDLLLENNVLDVRAEGRNNVYSLKESLEARNYILSAEIYKMGKFIKKHPGLRKELEELLKSDIPLIAVFGSYAGGSERKGSDIDIYIETKDRKEKEKISSLNRRFSVKTGMPNPGNRLIREISKTHVIVKGFERFHDKLGFLKKT